MITTAEHASVSQRGELHEQMRARYPDQIGYAERAGRRLHWELYGSGERTIFLLPTWSIIHSRFWKAQIPYLARHIRVLSFDGLGNGKSDRPIEPAAYSHVEFAADALAVMDATNTERAVIVSQSRGAQWALVLAADHAERVEGAVFHGPLFPASLASLPFRLMARRGFETDSARSLLSRLAGRLDEGALWFSTPVIERDYAGFVEWFQSQRVHTQMHSTKQIEDAIGWAMDTDAETLIATLRAPVMFRPRQLRAIARRISCPVLVVSGTDDRITPHADAKVLAKETGGRLVAVPGGDHATLGRRPVQFNLTLRAFIDGPRPERDPTVYRRDGRRRALFVSSPIGLGHARRDVAIARELRALVPDVEIDWLAQHPVTRMLEGEGERIHPASRHLASESGHIESECAEHDLHCFQAYRRMDEILVANFMVFHDVVSEERYDLWIGDEAWELDFFLHEHPGEKRAPFVWLTDFVGFLPMPDGGQREAHVAEDYNAEMVEHVAEHPGLRDRALFVGNPDDIVPGLLGPELPSIREWTEANFEFPGHITGFERLKDADRQTLRAGLGYAHGEQICIVTVGGTGVGESLLRRVIAAYPLAKERVAALRMIVVAGPRIEPDSLPRTDGLEIRAYVHDLYRHLAACDLAVVQGGLSTAMELTANRRPFIYFPLAHHFEQQFHVAHRLQRYRAGRRMDFHKSPPEAIADAIAHEIGRTVDYLPVETDGARNAARSIAQLL